jgi:YidC/Oxa1 family membrane protein insertase
MEQRNLILAIVASIAILLGFELLYNAPERERQAQQAAQQEQAQSAGPGSTTPSPQDGSGGVPGAAPGQAGALARGEVLDDTQRVEIDTPALLGSINTKGARIDDLTLRNYRQEVDDDSPRIDLLSPEGSKNAYYADFGWAPAAGAGLTVPDNETTWQVDSGGPLTPDNPVTLSWSNGDGLTFKRTFSIDDGFMFTVEQTVVNETGEPVSLAPYSLVNRRGTPDTLGYYILHEGPIGVFNGTLDEVDYDEVQEDGPLAYETTGGWIGITDKYWLVSLVPDQDRQVNARFISNQSSGGVAKYQADVLYPSQQVAPGETLSSTARLFAGAKEVSLLDGYSEQYGIPHFDKAVDFGWFYFLTKPIFQALHFFAVLTGNFGVAILILVVILKILLFPLANKSYRSMAKMRNLQPEMMKLRERFGDDKQRLNQEMMALYKREGANPASGCLPILLQIPIFFALYKVLFVTIEMRHAPFVGYLQDLSAKDPTSILNLFGILPWGVPELGILNILNIGFLPLIMGLSMYGQQMLNPQPTDPMQARIFQALPVVFTFILSQFPAGLVLYWTSNNVLTIGQQYIIMKRAGMQIGGKQQPITAGVSAGAAGGGSGGDGSDGGSGKSGGKSGGKAKSGGGNGGTAPATLEATAEEVGDEAQADAATADGQAGAQDAGAQDTDAAGGAQAKAGQNGGQSNGGGQAKSGSRQGSGGQQKRSSANPAAKKSKGSSSRGKRGGGSRKR